MAPGRRLRACPAREKGLACRQAWPTPQLCSRAFWKVEAFCNLRPLAVRTRLSLTGRVRRSRFKGQSGQQHVSTNNYAFPAEGSPPPNREKSTTPVRARSWRCTIISFR
jgi:hypothetical protein